MSEIIGTCSICGGPVKTHINGTKYCERCGAEEKCDYGPIIPMDPPYIPAQYPLVKYPKALPYMYGEDWGKWWWQTVC
jgi:hypothetical protein